MEATHTTAAIQGFLDELAGLSGDSPVEPVVRDLLARSAGRLHQLCATLLFRSYPRLTQGPLNLQSEEMLSAVVERLLKSRLDEAIDHVLQAGLIDPKLAVHQDKFGDELYASACACIQKIVSEDVQTKPSDQTEHPELRRQALELLRANLRFVTEVARDLTEVARPLSTWQTDPALITVRDTAELAKLSDAEREQWQRLWADVAAQVAAESPE